MAIQLKQFTDGKIGLVATCDICGRLCDSLDAVIAWNDETEIQSFYHPFQIACEDKCFEKLDCQPNTLYTQELGVALFFLLRNSKVNLNEAARNASILSEIE